MLIHSTGSVRVARPNFSFKKRQREQAKERKKQEKAERKAERANLQTREHAESDPALEPMDQQTDQPPESSETP